MNGYTVDLSAKATDWLEACRDAKLKRRIAATIDALAGNPRPPGCVKLAGEDFVWRVRVGDYRMPLSRRSRDMKLDCGPNSRLSELACKISLSTHAFRRLWD